MGERMFDTRYRTRVAKARYDNLKNLGYLPITASVMPPYVQPSVLAQLPRKVRRSLDIKKIEHGYDYNVPEYMCKQWVLSAIIVFKNNDGFAGMSIVEYLKKLAGHG